MHVTTPLVLPHLGAGPGPQQLCDVLIAHGKGNRGNLHVTLSAAAAENM